jgi:excisionase family DNA binding protein
MGSKQVQRDVGEPLFLTYQETAAKIGVSLARVRRLLRDGEIHNVKLGPRERRIPMSECEAYAARLVAEQIGAGPGAAA